MGRSPSLSYEYSSLPVQTLESYFEKEQLDLTPTFQRKSVWSAADRKRLIETILSGWPLPAIFLYKDRVDNNVVYRVIDGKQRLESVLMFMGKLKGGSFKAELELEDETCKEFDWPALERAREAYRIREYKFHVVEVDGAISSILRLFVDINSTGKALSAAERRKALFHDSPILVHAERLSKKFGGFLQQSKIVSRTQALRMKDIELMCELLASAYRGEVLDKKDSLNAIMGRDGAKEKHAKYAARQVQYALDFVKAYFRGIEATRFHQRSDFYSLVYCLIALRASDFIIDEPERAAQAWGLLRELSAGVDHAASATGSTMPKGPAAEVYIDYLATVKEGTDAKSKRDKRGKILRSLIESVFQRKDETRLFSDLQRRLLWNSIDQPVCEICKKPIESWDDFEADHRLPHSRGGATSLENAARTHRSCNRKKSSRVSAE
jgi:hypothetical protein